jgi:hypothetical protein
MPIPKTECQRHAKAETEIVDEAARADEARRNSDHRALLQRGEAGLTIYLF